MLKLTESNKKILQWLFRIGITVIFAFIVNKGVMKGLFADIGRSFFSWQAVGALVLGVAGFVCQACRWQSVARTQHFPLSLWAACKNLAWGNLLAFVTPGRIGEFGRGLGFNEARKSDSVAAVVMDKTFAVIAALAFGVTGIAAQIIVCRQYPPFQVTAGLSAILIAAPLIAWKLSEFNLPGRGRFHITAIWLNATIKLVKENITRKNIGLFSLLTHGILIVQTMLLLNMAGGVSWWRGAIIAAEVYTFMIFLPFFIANIGLREYSFAMLLRSTGPENNDTISIAGASLEVSTMLLTINILLPALGGIAVMLTKAGFREKPEAPAQRTGT